MENNNQNFTKSNKHRITDLLFIVGCVLLILIPVSHMDLAKGAVSAAENRPLAEKPELFESETLNSKYTSELTTYVGDRIGYRENFTKYYSDLQYRYFGTLPRGRHYELGPEGELNYLDEDITEDYQHFDLKSDEELNQIAESYQKLSDYMKNRGIQYYYMQCWDKQSIYPEYFPQTILQYGAESKTDQVMAKFESDTDIVVVNPKQALIDGKDQYEVYSRWGDATHWSERGAHIGYETLMETLNQYNDGKFDIMTDDDFDIEVKDRGVYIYGGVHEVNMSECFSRKVAHAEERPELLTVFSDINLDKYYVNPDAGNDTKVLILGDSYLYMSMITYLSEAFHDTIMLAGGDYRLSLETILDTYQPDIVINENAERVDRFDSIVQTVQNLGL